MKFPLPLLMLSLMFLGSVRAGEPDAGEVRAAMRSAAEYMLSISTEGGYLYKYAPDLSVRAGESMASETQIWNQHPGTPSMGRAFVNAYQATGDPFFLEAAQRAALSLVKCQLPSGGWHYSGDFDPKRENKDGVRSFQGERALDGPNPNHPLYFLATTYDDNVTQGVIGYLIEYLAASKHDLEGDQEIQAALDRALEGMLKAQFPNGAWPQRYTGAPRDDAEYPVLKASYPSSYPKTWPHVDYTAFYTLNDNSLRDCIFILFEAAERLDKPEYREAALKGADFLLLAQMPDPQPAWAQQYNYQMQPAWARVMEPPGISAHESCSAMTTLLEVYLKTGEEKYFQAVTPGIDWLHRSMIAPMQWSRLYELETNVPIYGGQDGKIHYELGEARPGYTWQSKFKIPELYRLFDAIKADGREAYLQAQEQALTADREVKSLAPKVEKILDSLDDKGRWITVEPMQKNADAEELISTRVFIENMTTLSRYLEQIRPEDGGQTPS